MVALVTPVNGIEEAKLGYLSIILIISSSSSLSIYLISISGVSIKEDKSLEDKFSEDLFSINEIKSSKVLILNLWLLTFLLYVKLKPKNCW